MGSHRQIVEDAATGHHVEPTWPARDCDQLVEPPRVPSATYDILVTRRVGTSDTRPPRRPGQFDPSSMSTSTGATG